jgi:VWFA-related protein
MVIALTTLLAMLPLHAADSPGFQIKVSDRVDQSRFPEITLQFAILDATGEPARNLPDEEVIVFEDKKEVHRLRLKGLRAEPMTPVLALDTSGSMLRQSKMEEAKRAAHHFFDKLEPQTPCGVVLFHHHPWWVEPITGDKKKLHALVDSAKAAGGTAYLDATAVAIDQLAEAKNSGQKAVVLMTDGRDVNSREMTLAEVIRKAKQHQVRFYALGLGEPGLSEPVRTILVLDRSGSMAEGNKIAGLKRAASRFVELMARDGADMTLIPFNHRVPTAAPFTNDRQALLDAIDELEPQGDTRLWDATYEALETLLASREQGGHRGRMAVIVLTDGQDRNSRRTMEDVIARAVGAEIPVFMLGLGRRGQIDEEAMQTVAGRCRGEYYGIEDPRQLVEVFEQLSIRLHDEGIDETSLRRLAAETGGEYYHVREADRLTAVFERVANQLENTYSVTYRSQRDLHDGTARGIEIRFGDLAVGETGYVTHGLLAATGDGSTRPPLEPVYLTLLIILGLLLALPALLRRRQS